MANAVFTTKAQPVYDDLPEWKYHFPKTYLKQASEAIGDLILYYEPRREGAELSGRSGRQVYFAIARLDRIEADANHVGYYYAYVSEYLEFPKPVPFRIDGFYFESALRKADGSTNKGAFGRSVRVIPATDFQLIWNAGFAVPNLDGPESTARVEEPAPPLRDSPRKVITERTFRDVAFGRVIHANYEGVCAMTGLNLVNLDGNHEVEAAHIRPVKYNGPDSPRNGIALSRTVHWLFDSGFLSVADTGEILRAKRHLPEKVRGLLNTNGRAQMPVDPMCRPHPEFLRYHREHVYKGG